MCLLQGIPHKNWTVRYYYIACKYTNFNSKERCSTCSTIAFSMSSGSSWELQILVKYIRFSDMCNLQLRVQMTSILTNMGACLVLCSLCRKKRPNNKSRERRTQPTWVGDSNVVMHVLLLRYDRVTCTCSTSKCTSCRPNSLLKHGQKCPQSARNMSATCTRASRKRTQVHATPQGCKTMRNSAQTNARKQHASESILERPM